LDLRHKPVQVNVRPPVASSLDAIQQILLPDPLVLRGNYQFKAVTALYNQIITTEDSGNRPLEPKTNEVDFFNEKVLYNEIKVQ
jgi:hypothetical protein